MTVAEDIVGEVIERHGKMLREIESTSETTANYRATSEAVRDYQESVIESGFQLARALEEVLRACSGLYWSSEYEYENGLEEVSAAYADAADLIQETIDEVFTGKE